jgi:hypothetical protein
VPGLEAGQRCGRVFATVLDQSDPVGDPAITDAAGVYVPSPPKGDLRHDIFVELDEARLYTGTSRAEWAWPASFLSKVHNGSAFDNSAYVARQQFSNDSFG